jgi:hypothetical protein
VRCAGGAVRGAQSGFSLVRVIGGGAGGVDGCGGSRTVCGACVVQEAVSGWVVLSSRRVMCVCHAAHGQLSCVRLPARRCARLWPHRRQPSRSYCPPSFDHCNQTTSARGVSAPALACVSRMAGRRGGITLEKIGELVGPSMTRASRVEIELA